VRLARGEKLGTLCREYAITRPTGGESVDGDLCPGHQRWKVSLSPATETVRQERVDRRIRVYYSNTPVREFDLATQRSTAVDRWTQPATCKASPDNSL
jgi:hypothetical protein